MKGLVYYIALWLLLVLGQASTRKVDTLTPLVKHGATQQHTQTVTDLEAAKSGHHVKSVSAQQGAKGQSLQGAAGQVAAKGIKSSEGHSVVHDEHAHKKGSQGKEKESAQYQEHGGKSHSGGGGGGHHQEHSGGDQGQTSFKYKGGDHRNKAGFTKGFHDKYHKDEYLKLDKFWSNANQKGQYHKFGEHGEHFHKEGSKHHKGGKNTKGSEAGQHGKKGKHAKGHQTSDHKGHKGHKGFEKQNAHSSQYAKKGGHKGGKHHTYKVHE